MCKLSIMLITGCTRFVRCNSQFLIQLAPLYTYPVNGCHNGEGIELAIKLFAVITQ